MLQSFKEFLIESYKDHDNGTYVSMKLSKESQKKLNDFIENRLHLSEYVNPDDFHITVIYSRVPVTMAEMYKGKLVEEKPAEILGYDIFGESKNCLVLRLKCPYAEFMNYNLTTLGASSEHKAYHPHLTLSYNYKDGIENLPIPMFKLFFDEVQVEPLDENWASKLKNK